MHYRKTIVSAPNFSVSTPVVGIALLIGPRLKVHLAVMAKWVPTRFFEFFIMEFFLVLFERSMRGWTRKYNSRLYAKHAVLHPKRKQPGSAFVSLFHCRLTPVICDTINMIYTCDRFHEDEEEVRTPNYYDYTTHPYNPNPPPSYNPYTTPQRPPGFFQYSTTKSPYDFNNFANQYTTKNPYQTTQNYYSQTTPNPYVGNYYQLIQQTTKNPYDFANFGRNNYDINNNYLKRSYNAANYYSDSSNVRNKSAVFNRGR